MLVNGFSNSIKYFFILVNGFSNSIKYFFMLFFLFGFVSCGPSPTLVPEEEETPNQGSNQGETSTPAEGSAQVSSITPAGGGDPAETSSLVVMSDLPQVIDTHPPLPLARTIKPALRPATFNDNPLRGINVVYVCQGNEENQDLYIGLQYRLQEYFNGYVSTEKESSVCYVEKHYTTLSKPAETIVFSKTSRTHCRDQLTKIIGAKQLSGYHCDNTDFFVAFQGRNQMVNITN